MLDARSAGSGSRSLQASAHLSHFAQHLYIGAGPLLLPLILLDLRLTYTTIGLIVAARTFCAGFLQLFYTELGKRFSSKAILGWSNALAALSSFGMAASGSLASLLPMNVLWGVATSPLHPLAGTLTMKRPAGRAGGLNLRLFYSVAYVGNIVGALLAFLCLGSIGWTGVLAVAGTLTALPFLHACYIQGDEVALDRTRRPPLQDVREALRDRRVVATSLAGVLFFGSTNVFVRHMMPLFLTNGLHTSIRTASSVFISVSILGIASPMVFGRLARTIGLGNVLVALAAASGASFVYLATCSAFTVATIAALSVVAFLAWPLLALMQEFLIDALEPPMKSAGANVLLTVNICSFILWASGFGVVIDRSGSFRAVFYLVSLLCLVSIPLLLFATRARRSQ